MGTSWIVFICRDIFTNIMKLLVILAVVSVANSASLFGGSYLELETNAAGQITDGDVEQVEPVLKSVAVHAATAPVVTSYSATAAAASPILSVAPAVISPSLYNVNANSLVYTNAAAPTIYRAPSPVVYRAPSPVMYRIPTPVIYKAPASAPIVVQAPPRVIVKTVHAPAPEPITKIVYVDDSGEDEEDAPTLYTASETTDESSEENV